MLGSLHNTAIKLDEHIPFNEGIYLSLKNAGWTILLFGAFFSLIFGSLLGVYYGCPGLLRGLQNSYLYLYGLEFGSIENKGLTMTAEYFDRAIQWDLGPSAKIQFVTTLEQQQWVIRDDYVLEIDGDVVAEFTEWPLKWRKPHTVNHNQTINQLLDELAERLVLDVFQLIPQSTAQEDIWASLVANPMPDELKTVLARAGGATFYHYKIYLFTEGLFEDLNQPQNKLFIPSAIFFAQDGGSRYFFVDSDDSLGCGVGAVFAVGRGHRNPEASVPCGRTMAEFLRAVMDRREVWEGLTLEMIAADRMSAALKKYPHQWQGQKGATFHEIRSISKKYKYMLPYVLERLLKQSNGLIFSSVGVRVYATEEIKAVEALVQKNGKPGAYLFAEDKRGNFYALTFDPRVPRPQSWPRDKGWVVCLQPGHPVQSAEVVGYLPDVVIRWLEVNDV